MTFLSIVVLCAYAVMIIAGIGIVIISIRMRRELEEVRFRIRSLRKLMDMRERMRSRREESP